MTLGELREMYKKLIELLDKLDKLGDVYMEITIDVTEEWAFLCYGENIYLEFNKNDNMFRTRIKDDDVRQAMHTAIDMSNNEDQGD